MLRPMRGALATAADTQAARTQQDNNKCQDRTHAAETPLPVYTNKSSNPRVKKREVMIVSYRVLVKLRPGVCHTTPPKKPKKNNERTHPRAKKRDVMIVSLRVFVKLRPEVCTARDTLVPAALLYTASRHFSSSSWTTTTSKRVCGQQ
jgi:hypothetical protein